MPSGGPPRTARRVGNLESAPVMETPLLVFDLLLAGLLLWLAWRALAVADLFQGIVLFISLGLCMALAWVRLRAPDIALVEAAVGSGITGSLLLAAWSRMRTHSARDSNPAEDDVG